MHSISLPYSYGYCRRLARRAAGNFYHAFLLLPRPQHLAMCALYSFLRIADDLSDNSTDTDSRRAQIQSWRESLHAALAGDFHHPALPALADSITRFRIPPEHLEAVLDGVSMDLTINQYTTFPDLYRYCYHVASAVGLCCIHIWGFTGAAYPPAEAAGIALQLTNILRDLAEDSARGRLYLPTEDLDRFGCSHSQFRHGPITPALRDLLHFQATRAYTFYDQACHLIPCLHPPGRAVFLVMLRTYRALLDEIVSRDFDVFSTRVRVPNWYKIWLALQALPVRYRLLSGR